LLLPFGFFGFAVNLKIVPLAARNCARARKTNME
jgi:hypothetical protein